MRPGGTFRAPGHRGTGCRPGLRPRDPSSCRGLDAPCVGRTTGARAMADVDSPTYSTLTISAATRPVLGGSASTFRGRRRACLAWQTGPSGATTLTRFLGGSGGVERAFALQHWPETEGAGVMASGMPTGCPVMCGVGGTTYSVVKVRSDVLAPWPVGPDLPRVCAGRTLATASQVSTSSVGRGLRVFAVVSPWPRRAATAPCPIRRVSDCGLGQAEARSSQWWEYSTGVLGCVKEVHEGARRGFWDYHRQNQDSQDYGIVRIGLWGVRWGAIGARAARVAPLK